MPCPLPDLECRDARASRARREAGAQAVARIPGRVEPCGGHPIANDQGGSYGFLSEDGYSLADRRNKLVVSGTVQLPWNMQVSAIVDLRSSVPFNPATSRDINNDGYTIDTPVGVGFRSGCRDMNLDAVNAYRAASGLATVASVACPTYQDTDIRFSKFFCFCARAAGWYGITPPTTTP